MSRVLESVKTALVVAVMDKPGLVMSVCTALLLLVAARSLAGSGLDQSGDLVYHIGGEYQVAEAIKEGRNPFGPLSINFGSPMLKFYQPFLYLVIGTLHAVTGVDILMVHHIVLLLLFLLTPFTLYYGYRHLGLPELAAGFGVVLTTLSVAGFGNSFEAYFTVGVVNQMMGAVFFPLFLGFFNQLLQGKRGPIPVALLFALTFISHVMMAVYATFAGGLLFLTDRRPIRSLLKPLAVFAVLSCLLLTFWFVPFVAAWEKHRPIPKSVDGAGFAFYLASLTVGETSKLLFSGRLLDDAHVSKIKGKQDDLDALSDRVNMCPTFTTRPPVVTVLVLLGLALSLLFRLRSPPHRFLVAGFLFSFLVLSGPDDVPWLRYIPFTKRLEFFRSTYLFEFFAYGLAGSGLHLAGGLLAPRLRNLGRSLRIAAKVGVVLLALAGAGIFLLLFFKLSTIHVTMATNEAFEQAVSIAEPIHRGFPLRVVVDHKSFKMDKRETAYMGGRGQRAVCGHWRIIGPSSARYLCATVRQTLTSPAIARKIGIGYYLVHRDYAKAFEQLKDSEGNKVMRQVKRGYGHYLYYDTKATYLWAADRAVLTIASDAQWFYVVRSWVGEIQKETNGAPPTPVRPPDGQPIDQQMLEAVEGVWVLSPDRLTPADLHMLADYADGGGNVFSVRELPGVATSALSGDGPRLFDTMTPSGSTGSVEISEKEAAVGGPFVYAVRTAAPRFVVLPDFAVDGWRVQVDGKGSGLFTAGPDMVGALIPAGSHTVRIRWETSRFEWLCYMISLMALTGIAAISVIGWRRKRR